MFDRLKKVFVNQKSNDGRAALADGSLATLTNSANTLPTDAVSEWAGIQGFSYTGLPDGSRFSLTGMVGNKPCKLERAVSSRDYIVGEELRARAEIKVNDKVSVLIMNRALKESLEERAYEVYTDTLETEARPNLMEEMRWLAMYPEAGVPVLQLSLPTLDPSALFQLGRLLAPLRAVLPSLGPFDISPLVLYYLLQFVGGFIVRAI